ncbi:phosphoribosylanthranilate isomerase [Tranquillimonas rosea]|uniref:N-(5'-phosphoribosyl)anthranilate isomerase n=1 Tax=Tranquillimonas rosea TaxID=641238 RepID=A0A1H9TT92_9RHOB|nr:phosphoribosylanthranilate isomerase [Tranquillimonas rosea]SES00319.1 phosphoribosylanthranilate isomerase [Tranquillimonas rosea]
MLTETRIKICGITETPDIPAAILAGASYLGFVFFEKSPRNLALNDAAFMATSVPVGIAKVGLTVDADDARLDEILAEVPLDMLQLHGSETPERVAAVRERFGLPVMKAVGIAHEDDLSRLDEHARAADQLLIDAKAPKDAPLPGGNGLSFDWRLIAGRRWSVPWMLAGGLNADNVAEAVRLTGATQVDVSSGVESAPGVKDADRMTAFCRAARG